MPQAEDQQLAIQKLFQRLNLTGNSLRRQK